MYRGFSAGPRRQAVDGEVAEEVRWFSGGYFILLKRMTSPTHQD